MHGATALASRDFVPAFLITSLLSMLSAACFMPLEAEAGAEVSGRPAELASTIRPVSEAE